MAQSPSPQVFPDRDAQQIAYIFGLHSALQQLRELQTHRLPAETPTLQELALRQEVLEQIQAATLDVDSVTAELTNEQGDLGTLRTELQVSRDKKVSRLTTASLLTGSAIGAGVSATQFTGLSTATQNTGDAVGIGSGAVSTVLSVLAARAQNGPSGSVGEIPNMLAPLIGGTPVLHTYYPPAVMRFLETVPPGDEPSEGTRLEQLRQTWSKAGRLSANGGAAHEQKLAALTVSGDPKVKVTISDLTDRIAMLGDVRGRVFLIKRDLSTLMRTYMARENH